MEPFLDFGLFELAIASFVGFLFKRARGRTTGSHGEQPRARNAADALPPPDARDTPDGEDHGR